jgi:hypothetical protein
MLLDKSLGYARLRTVGTGMHPTTHRLDGGGTAFVAVNDDRQKENNLFKIFEFWGREMKYRRYNDLTEDMLHRDKTWSIAQRDIVTLCRYDIVCVAVSNNDRRLCDTSS